MRTELNDNDKAKKYFRDPAEILREKNAVLRGSESEEGNALVEKLKAQTETNRERNKMEVEIKTFENDQVRIDRVERLLGAQVRVLIEFSLLCFHF